MRNITIHQMPASTQSLNKISEITSTVVDVEHCYSQSVIGRLQRKRKINQEKVNSNDVDKLCKYVCPYCKFELSSRQSLHRHKKNKHPDQKNNEPTQNTIQCFKCGTFRCYTRKELIAHLNSDHEQHFLIQQTELPNKRNFDEWLADIEKSYGTYFIKSCQSKKYQDHVTTYYYCNRSGSYVSKSSGQKALKSQGSSKISGHCSAFLTLTTYESTGRVSVEYCIDHVHDTRIEHLKMSNNMRSFIVGKLSSGVDSKVLLDEIRDNLSKRDGRDKIITHKDILNIKNQYNINVANRDRNETEVISEEEIIDTNDVNSNNNSEYFERVLGKATSQSCNLWEVKKIADESISELMEVIRSSNDANTINCSLKYIKGAIATIKGLSFALSDKDFDITDKQPSKLHS